MSSCSHETPARVAESQEVATPAPRSRGLAERLRLDAPDETLHGGPRLLEPRLVGDMALLGAATTEIGEGHHQALRLGSSQLVLPRGHGGGLGGDGTSRARR